MVLLAPKIGFMQNKKSIVGVLLIATTALCFLIIPDVAGINIELTIKLSAIVLLSVYIGLSLGMVHRTTLALFGAVAEIVNYYRMFIAKLHLINSLHRMASC